MVRVEEVPERSPEEGRGAAEVAELSQRVETARNKLPLQADSALFDVLSESELQAERQLAEWIRRQRRDQRRKVVAAEAAAADRERRMLSGVARAADEDGLWHRRAIAAQRRVSSPHARLARLHKRSEWSSRALVGVVLVGMSWAALNVQHNLVPDGNMANPLFWLSFGVEAMISIPLVVIMLVATTAATWGREIKRHKIIAFELGLLLATVGLNTGPHIAEKQFVKAAEYAVAPIMVGVVIWLHAWISNQYASLIADAEVPDEEPEQPVRMAHPPQTSELVAAERVMSDRLAPERPAPERAVPQRPAPEYPVPERAAPERPVADERQPAPPPPPPPAYTQPPIPRTNGAPLPQQQPAGPPVGYVPQQQAVRPEPARTEPVRREPLEPGQPVRRDPALKARAFALRDEGVPLSRIADQLGVSRRTLSRMFADAEATLSMPAIGPIARQLVRTPPAVPAPNGHQQNGHHQQGFRIIDAEADDDDDPDDDQRPPASSSGSVDPDWIDAQFMEESRS